MGERDGINREQRCALGEVEQDGARLADRLARVELEHGDAPVGVTREVLGSARLPQEEVDGHRLVVDAEFAQQQAALEAIARGCVLVEDHRRAATLLTARSARPDVPAEWADRAFSVLRGGKIAAQRRKQSRCAPVTRRLPGSPRGGRRATLCRDGKQASTSSLRAPRAHDLERRRASAQELCDLYGAPGSTSSRSPTIRRRTVTSERTTSPAYLERSTAEAERARRLYGLLVIPGLELTFDDADPTQAGHAVALGLRDFVGVEDGLEQALRAARAHGAALVAAHPYSLPEALSSTRERRRSRPSRRVSRRSSTASSSSTATRCFPGSPQAGLPAVASGDFHTPRASPDLEDAHALRQGRAGRRRLPPLARPAFLVQLEQAPARLSRAA